MTDLTALYHKILEKNSLEFSSLPKSSSKEVEIFNKLSRDLRGVKNKCEIFLMTKMVQRLKKDC